MRLLQSQFYDDYHDFDKIKRKQYKKEEVNNMGSVRVTVIR